MSELKANRPTDAIHSSTSCHKPDRIRANASPHPLIPYPPMLAVIRFCFSYPFRLCFWTQRPGDNMFWDIDDVHTNVTLHKLYRII